MYSQCKKKMTQNGLPVLTHDGKEPPVDAPIPYDEHRRNEMLTFMKYNIIVCLAKAGYVSLTVISMGFIPLIFHPMKWYFVLVAYFVLQKG